MADHLSPAVRDALSALGDMAVRADRPRVWTDDAPTVTALHTSAVELVRAMCAVGRTAAGGGNG